MITSTAAIVLLVALTTVSILLIGIFGTIAIDAAIVPPVLILVFMSLMLFGYIFSTPSTFSFTTDTYNCKQINTLTVCVKIKE